MPTSQDPPSSSVVDAVEAPLWRLACALTGDRGKATHVLCTVLANAERPGRGGGAAPVGPVRLARAIALVSRDAQPGVIPPFDARIDAEAASLWKALHALPRAERVAWTIARLGPQPLLADDAAFVMGAPAEVFAEAQQSAERMLGVSLAGQAALLTALTPMPQDGVDASLGAMRERARRRWRRTSAALLFAFLAFTLVFGSIMLDLVGRDAKDAKQREALDRAQRAFSNPMPPEERDKP